MALPQNRSLICPSLRVLLRSHRTRSRWSLPIQRNLQSLDRAQDPGRNTVRLGISYGAWIKDFGLFRPHLPDIADRASPERRKRVGQQQRMAFSGAGAARDDQYYRSLAGIFVLPVQVLYKNFKSGNARASSPSPYSGNALRCAWSSSSPLDTSSIKV